MSRPKQNEPQETDSPVKKLRLAAGLSQEALALNTGVALSTIRRWEINNCEPTMTVAQMRNFCSAVGKKFDQLPTPLGGTQTEQRRQAVLDYLRSHPDDQNTINLLSDKLKLTQIQTRSAVENLEFKGLICRYAEKIPGRGGVEYTNFVYKAIV